VSCQKNKDSSDKPREENSKTGVVPFEVATNIATNFFKMYYSNVDNKLIDNQLTADENGLPLFYVFNYKGGGFLVVSAEYGDMPILANDVESVFPAKGEKINAGLGMWLIDTRDRIVAIRNGKEATSKIGVSMWNDFKNNTYKANFKKVTVEDIRREANKLQVRDDDLGIPYDPIYCNTLPYSNSQLGPLLVTTWGQGCGYNTLVPTAAQGPCGHMPAGCVATSMAQIMKFHSFVSPSTRFNFSIMPNSPPGNNEIAKLIRDCGSLVGMLYNVDGSGTQTYKVEAALEHLGYSHDACFGSYNSSIHMSNLLAGRPVLLDGCTELNCFLWWCWGSGKCHTWVSDGFQMTSHQCFGNTTYWHMNWGWDGEAITANGFYYNPIPQNIPNFYRNYQYNRNILYNIHP
jgi:hypothetical protein